MAKVIVTSNGLIQQEVALNKSRLTIGRRTTNDLVLDQSTISGQHAAIDISSVGVFVLDLGSTNGTLVNGQPITKHLLQHDDVIEIGKYKLIYQSDTVQFDEKTAKQVLAAEIPPEMAKTTTEPAAMIAKIKVLNGSNAGRELLLNKPVTTLGSQGVLVVSITREQQHYFITHIEGHSFAKINEQAIDGGLKLLTDGNVIDLSGIKMKFYLTE